MTSDGRQRHVRWPVMWTGYNQEERPYQRARGTYRSTRLWAFYLHVSKQLRWHTTSASSIRLPRHFVDFSQPPGLSVPTLTGCIRSKKRENGSAEGIWNPAIHSRHQPGGDGPSARHKRRTNLNSPRCEVLGDVIFCWLQMLCPQ